MSVELTRRHLVAGALAAASLAACGGSRNGERGEATPTTSVPLTDAPSPSSDPEDTDGQSPEYVPGPTEWARLDGAALAEAGWSADALAELATFVEAKSSRTLIVVVGGRLAAEHYWSGTTAESAQEIASCQKSVVSTLCGIAIDQGRLGLDDPVTDHLGTGWSAASPTEEAAITVRHLLSMTSGLDQETLTVVAPPGTDWTYNTTAYQRLRPVLEAVMSDDIESLTRAWLWDPIDVSASSGWRERLGDGPMAVDAIGERLWGLQMTARDMARFGLLVQRRGRWGTDQVVSAGWFDKALAPSQDMNPVYGYLWWLASAVGGSDEVGVPRDLVAALGAGDQKIYVCPSLDCVVVRQGSAANEPSGTASSFDRDLVGHLLAAAPA